MPKIQLRHDTSTNWTTYNPVLLEGEVGVETDTNKMKIGDGTTAYNSLDYFGGDVDAYTKSETDALLENKQNVLNPNPPLAISDREISYVSGMTAVGGNPYHLSPDGFSDSTKPKFYRTDAYTLYANFATTPLLSYDNDDTFWDSCIKFPYQMGQIVCSGKAVYRTNYGITLDTAMIFGYEDNGKFIPVFIPRQGTSDGVFINPQGGYEASIDNTNIERTYQTWEWVDRSSSQGDLAGSWENRPYGFVVQIMQVGEDSYTFRCNSDRFYQAYTNNSTQAIEFSKINQVRIIPNDWTGYFYTPDAGYYDFTNVGVYPGTTDEDNPYTITNGVTPQQGDFGTSLYDITEPLIVHELSLSIGSGLAVQDGNLVNTNPTPADVSMKVTGDGISTIKALTQAEYDALATKDTNTFYVIVQSNS